MGEAAALPSAIPFPCARQPASFRCPFGMREIFIENPKYIFKNTIYIFVFQCYNNKNREGVFLFRPESPQSDGGREETAIGSENRYTCFFGANAPKRQNAAEFAP